MENNRYPEQEQDLLPVEEFPEVPMEEVPVFEELSYAPAAPFSMDDDSEDGAFLIGEAPAEPAYAYEPEEEIPVPSEETAFVTEDDTQPLFEEEPTVFEEPSEPSVSFMDRIPDVAEDYPEELPEEIVTIEEETVSDSVPETVEAEVVSAEPEETVPAEEPVQKKAASQERATKKGRPKRKKGEGLFGIPNILATGVWLALIVAIGVTLGRMLWVCAADVLAFGRPDKQVTVTVYEADSMEDIVDKLHNAGLIRYKSLFNLYASISDAEEDIKPGIYDLNTRYDYHALVNFMSPSSTRSVIEVTIPEGYTCRQIFALLEENRVCTIQDIASYAADGKLSDYWFLENVERGSEYCLEGYLFPDTYQFYKNSSPREALEKMLNNFENRFTEEMRAQLDALNANVTDGSFTANDVVIVASLIEKESAAPAESPKIAGVIYNRLYNWDYPALLNIDAAIVYAQGGDTEVIDTGIDSPYNTYRYTGLTPTAIANPGLSSLKAALNPESHGYYYYVLNPSTGMHQFSVTQEEHNSYVSAFYH